MRSYRGLWLRILSAAILIPTALYTVMAGGWWYATWIGFFASVMAFEWTRLVFPADKPRAIWALTILYIGTILWLAVAGTNSDWTLVLSIAGVAFIGSVLVAILTGISVFWAGLGAAYLLIPESAFFWLRAETTMPIATIIWLYFLTWATDTGGFIAGKSIGGPKLARNISPNKTWSGFGGGVVLALGVGLITTAYVGWQHLPYILALSLLMSVASQLGDLFESAIKRHFGVKDMSGFIPGHGGVMDRMDGLVFVALAAALVGLLNDGNLLNMSSFAWW